MSINLSAYDVNYPDEGSLGLYIGAVLKINGKVSTDNLPPHLNFNDGYFTFDLTIPPGIEDNKALETFINDEISKYLGGLNKFDFTLHIAGKEAALY